MQYSLLKLMAWITLACVGLAQAVTIAKHWKAADGFREIPGFRWGETHEERMKRKGMTILEVLFAILITTIGLLGAVALFPVAGQMARRGRLNDMVTVCGDSAVHKFDTQGMRRPDRWIAFVDGSATNQAATPYPGTALATTFPAAYWKTSFCLDPRFTAQNLTHANNEQRWTYFPAFPQASPASPRMQRITLTSAGPGSAAMERFQANFNFSFEDELVYERPKDNSVPAFQTYSPIKTSNGILPGKREDEGRLSWMATIVPKIDLNTGSRPDSYVISIVVFYSRSPALVTRDFNVAIAPPFAEDRWPDNEWTGSIAGPDFYSQGFGGGEVRIHADYAEKLSLKTGDWVMLAGNSPAIPDASGNPTTFAPIFKWYKVSDVSDLETATINNVSVAVRDVTLVGPDWDLWDLNKDGITDDVEVTVMPGVVSVLERTVRLEMDGN